jgi:hypothetical protein
VTTISLDGDWQLTYFPEGEYPVADPDDLRNTDAPTITARVPGNVELDLVRAGAIPEPFYADNVRHLRTFEPCEWPWASLHGTGDGSPPRRGGCGHSFARPGPAVTEPAMEAPHIVGGTVTASPGPGPAVTEPGDGSPPHRGGCGHSHARTWASRHGTPHYMGGLPGLAIEGEVRCL